MGSAAMDRLVHRALKITIEGDSYRMNSFVKSTKELASGAQKLYHKRDGLRWVSSRADPGSLHLPDNNDKRPGGSNGMQAGN
jgi:hypothetical protein